MRDGVSSGAMRLQREQSSERLEERSSGVDVG